jgi:hypothetical protein
VNQIIRFLVTSGLECDCALTRPPPPLPTWSASRKVRKCLVFIEEIRNVIEPTVFFSACSSSARASARLYRIKVNKAKKDIIAWQKNN